MTATYRIKKIYNKKEYESHRKIAKRFTTGAQKSNIYNAVFK